jgi:phage gpG-like protein
MKAQLTGTAELKRALAEFGINADKELAAIVRGTAQNVRSHAIRSIQRGTKSGITYEKIDPRRTHRASAPGEAPATDTGRLANSIQADIEGKNATVFTNVEYAPWLEFGTRTIEPRPFMFPALEKERPAWNRRLNTIVDQAAKGIIK